MSRDRNWSRAKNVLCVRLDGLGDLLMTTPALRALKSASPARRLTLLTSAMAAQAAPLIEEIDDVIVYEVPWMKATPPRPDSKRDHAMIEQLRARGFDAAVIFTVYSQNPLPAALLCYLADIPLRLAHCRENPYQLLTDWIAEREPQDFIRHEVRRQLDLVAAIGCATDNERLSLRVPTSARRRVRALLRDLGLDEGNPWLLVHPGASAPSRRYPPEGFAAAARILHEDHGFEIVFAGACAERPLVEQIQELMGAPSYSLAGALDLAELAALIAQAPVLLCNNTAPAHLAAAVGTPVVDLYALTNPQHTPWAVPNRVLNHDVSCKYCYKSVCPEGHHDCLRRVAPAAIVQAVRELFAKQRRDRATATKSESLPLRKPTATALAIRSNE